jgi:hypothetical protein
VAATIKSGTAIIARLLIVCSAGQLLWKGTACCNNFCRNKHNKQLDITAETKSLYLRKWQIGPEKRKIKKIKIKKGCLRGYYDDLFQVI